MNLKLIILLCVAPVAMLSASTLVSFDAALAGSGVTPTGVDPAWTYSGGGNPQMVNNGSYLLQDNPSGAYGEYYSPSAPAGTMVFLTSTYGISFTIQPLTDTVAGDWSNLYVGWADNAWFYNVTIDKYAGGESSGTGDIVYRQSSFIPAVTGIDWSVAHDVFIGVRGTAGPYGEFDFYLDGIYQTTIGGGSFANSRSGWEFLENRVAFGDGTSGGTEVQAQWYSVAIHDTATPIPEPVHLALAGLTMLGLYQGRRKIFKKQQLTA